MAPARPENPARRIVFGPVAGTEIAARPVGDRRRRARLRIEQRDTAKMRADADQDAEFRLDRARGVGRVGGLLDLLGIRIGQQRQQFRVLVSSLQRFGSAVEDEDRPLAPTDDHLLAGLDFADVEIDRAAGGKRRGVRVHLRDQRHQVRRPRRPRRPCRWRYRGSRGAKALPGGGCQPLRSLPLLAMIAPFQARVSPRLYWRCSASVNQGCTRSAAFARAKVASGVPEASMGVQSSAPRSYAPAPAPRPRRRRRHRARGRRRGRAGSRGLR